MADRFAKHPTGCDYWYEAPLEEIVPEGLKCPHCGGQHWEKEDDILDVWFDSGTSFAAVLESRPELSAPADLYLEGSDQHRGWFHSSLLVAEGTRNDPPYKAVLTHGYVVDGDGRKMSKSYNNGIFLRDTMADIEPKVRGMFTDPARLRKSDPGNPDVCNLFPYHVLLASPEEQAEIRTGCTGASFGCVECKKRFLKNLEAFLAPLQERRAALSARPGAVAEILAAGNERARAFASATLAEVRAKMGL